MVADKAENAAQGGIDAVQDLRVEFAEFRRQVKQASQRHCILEALRFEKMDERFEDVKSEHAKTFEWIFTSQGKETQLEDPTTQPPFIQWLKHGSGIFHIEGKAGSGKSTLMKFICRSSSTEEALDEWRAGKQLISGRFFFWKPGSSLQRSLKGLTRALLHSILEQAPELIEATFPKTYQKIGDPWNAPSAVKFGLGDIQQAFVRLVGMESVYLTRRMCFFIDGLDEFDEANELDPEDHSCYSDLIRIFRDWTRDRPGVKLCVSSRDWKLFEKAFDPWQRIRLQDLTRGDMKTMVYDSLKEHGGSFYTEADSESELGELVEKIVERAEGVFLWVILVLKSRELINLLLAGRFPKLTVSL